MSKKAIIKTQYHCRNCKHSYDWHEKAYNTEQPFMCRCKYHHDGMFIKFLNDNQCDNFKLKV